MAIYRKNLPTPDLNQKIVFLGFLDDTLMAIFKIIHLPWLPP